MLARPRIASQLLAVVTAVALVLAPAFPAFGHAGGSDAPAAQTAAAHAHHAQDTDHGEAALKASPCSQHEGCSTQCCATCAQCFTAAPVVPAVFFTTYPQRLSAATRQGERSDGA
jgi:hypothetical protein